MSERRAELSELVKASQQPQSEAPSSVGPPAAAPPSVSVSHDTAAPARPGLAHPAAALPHVVSTFGDAETASPVPGSSAAAVAAADAPAATRRRPPPVSAPPPTFVYYEYTVTVGKKPSGAQYFLDDTQQVEDALKALALASAARPLMGGSLLPHHQQPQQHGAAAAETPGLFRAATIGGATGGPLPHQRTSVGDGSGAPHPFRGSATSANLPQVAMHQAYSNRASGRTGGGSTTAAAFAGPAAVLLGQSMPGGARSLAAAADGTDRAKQVAGPPTLRFASFVTLPMLASSPSGALAGGAGPGTPQFTFHTNVAPDSSSSAGPGAPGPSAAPSLPAAAPAAAAVGGIGGFPAFVLPGGGAALGAYSSSMAQLPSHATHSLLRGRGSFPAQQPLGGSSSSSAATRTAPGVRAGVAGAMAGLFASTSQLHSLGLAQSSLRLASVAETAPGGGGAARASGSGGRFIVEGPEGEVIVGDDDEESDADARDTDSGVQHGGSGAWGATATGDDGGSSPLRAAVPRAPGGAAPSQWSPPSDYTLLPRGVDASQGDDDEPVDF